jgi:hypothetical protein
MSGSGGVYVFRVDLHARCQLVCPEAEAVHGTRLSRSRRPLRAARCSEPTAASLMDVQPVTRSSSVFGAES